MLSCLVSTEVEEGRLRIGTLGFSTAARSLDVGSDYIFTRLRNFSDQNILWAVYKYYTLYKTDTYLWVLNFRLPAAREVRRPMSVSGGYRSVRGGGWGVGGGGRCRGRGVRRLRGVVGLLIVWFLRAIEDSAVLHRTALVLTRRCNWWRWWGRQDDQIPCGVKSMIVEKVDEIRPGKVKIMKRGSLQGKDRYKGGRGGCQGRDGGGGGGLVLTCTVFHQTGRGGRRHHGCILMQLVMAVVWVACIVCVDRLRLQSFNSWNGEE